MELLIRILVAIGIIWLVQTLIAPSGLQQEPAAKILFVVTIIVVVLWLVSGQVGFSIP